MYMAITGIANRFRRDLRGNVAMMFGLCVIGVIGFTGLAVDYARQQTAATKIQAAADNVALALAHDAKNLSAGELQARAQVLFSAAIAAQGYTGASISAQFTNGAPSALTISATAGLDSMFGNLFGAQKLPIAASARVPIRSTRLEIALVLDNTGSMSGSGKLTELKKASKSLIEIVKNAAASAGNQARISLVPFASAVNIGTESTNQTWLDWSSFGHGKDNWNGCLIDRNPPNDTRNTKPNGDDFTWYPTANCSVGKLVPLTSDWTALESAVDGMTASGMTNVTIGVAWGYNMLTEGAPLSTAEPFSSAVSKFMIVLTDGMNTKNRWTTDSTQIDARTRQVCENVRNDGTIVYSVRVINGSASLIRDCATDPSKYYDIDSASQLTAVFKSIARQMVTTIYLGG